MKYIINLLESKRRDLESDKRMWRKQNAKPLVINDIEEEIRQINKAIEILSN